MGRPILLPWPGLTRFGIEKEVFLKSRIIGMPLHFSPSSVRRYYTIRGHLAIFIGQIPCCCRSPWHWQHSQCLLISTSDTLLFVVFGILDLELSTLKYVGGLSVAFEAPGCSSEPLDLISISELPELTVAPRSPPASCFTSYTTPHKIERGTQENDSSGYLYWFTIGYQEHSEKLAEWP